ncbi:hypothetical protein [Streptomyces sp. NPDC048527]|uniref:hypothetical protein n=1 Tax=Streptomyces sp. NPDC048527 TaxID=3365568 RepID=UPI003716D200
MIGLRIGTAAPGRRWGRTALLVGLVVLLAAHLAGTAHASAFAGPHVEPLVVACSHHDAQGAAKTVVPRPGHDHSADGHIDHGVDRVGAKNHVRAGHATC